MRQDTAVFLVLSHKVTEEQHGKAMHRNVFAAV